MIETTKTEPKVSKLAQLQSELKAPKNQRNNFGNYNYRSCEDILEAVKPLLVKFGATLVITDDIQMVGDRYYVKATASIEFGDDEAYSATAFAREPEVKRGMDDSQITGTASSYARKYCLNGLFCIDDTKDADTDEHAKITKKAEKKESSKPVYNIDFKEVRERIKEIKTVSELNLYWTMLSPSDKQAEILKPDFAKRKAELGEQQ